MGEYFLIAWLFIPSAQAPVEAEAELNRLGLRWLMASTQTVGPFQGEAACDNAVRA